MNEMENKLKKYYEEVGIASVKGVIDREGNYDYEKMFDSFCCPNKGDCREVCEKAYKSSDRFLFSPRTEEATVSQYYSEKKYKGHRIPRIVVVSLSASEPMRKPEEDKSLSLNPHWRGTTTTIRSLLDPFVDLAPAGDWSDESTKVIKELFVHVRTAKCFSNVGGPGQEPNLLYENCGEYLSKEVSILKPDVVVTQGVPARLQAEKHVFDENARNTKVEEVESITDSIARIVRLKEDDWKVYWLRPDFPNPRTKFYSEHAGKTVDSESHIAGAKRENLVRYGRDIKKFMDEEGR